MPAVCVASGSPQIDFATESVMDELAQQLGMTPWAFREKNLLRDGDISGSGQPMRDVSAGVCLERLRREFGEDLRPFVRNGKLVGRGIAACTGRVLRCGHTGCRTPSA